MLNEYIKHFTSQSFESHSLYIYRDFDDIMRSTNEYRKYVDEQRHVVETLPTTTDYNVSNMHLHMVKGELNSF